MSIELISTCSSKYGDCSWDSQTWTKANSFLHQHNSFEFLVSFCITMRVFSNLRYVTINLQKRTHDVNSVYENISDVQLELELLKKNVNQNSMLGLKK